MLPVVSEQVFGCGGGSPPPDANSSYLFTLQARPDANVSRLAGHNPERCFRVSNRLTDPVWITICVLCSGLQYILQ